MTKLSHGLLQALGLATNVTVLSTSLVPDHYKALVAGLVAVAQALLALYNHGSSNVSKQS